MVIHNDYFYFKGVSPKATKHLSQFREDKSYPGWYPFLTGVRSWSEPMIGKTFTTLTKAERYWKRLNSHKSLISKILDWLRHAGRVLMGLVHTPKNQ